MSDEPEFEQRDVETKIGFGPAIVIAAVAACLAVAGSNFFPIRHRPSPEELHDAQVLLQLKESTAQQTAAAANQAATQARILSMQENIIKACSAAGGVPLYINQNLDCRKK
jgi:hypothetical protein